ncbi:ABC transporter ATP-binding protein [Clostridiaceae bacterium M8S5]|nr:ABC transporter ATP-binding protein [Clostridiaceae bacterium M8S5]
MKNILRVENIEKYYGKKGNIVKAVDDITFDIKEGEFVGIMGPSGSGKTTLLNVISTIDTVSAGHIYIEEVDVTDIAPKDIAKFRREKLGFIFQDFNLLDTLTIQENIALALVINKYDTNAINMLVLESAKQLGIDDILDKYPCEVSGGQKQRTACARAIVSKSKLILADEPTGSLDSKSAQMLIETISDMNKELGSTIMMVTHDSFTASYCSRILFIKDGRIFTELVKGEDTRKQFFNKILDVIALLGGDMRDVY